jgi:tRNA A37 threonylcarbamoyltransferase TsaD
VMCAERGGKLHAMDERYCIDNGAMIGAHACFPLWAVSGLGLLHCKDVPPDALRALIEP